MRAPLTREFPGFLARPRGETGGTATQNRGTIAALRADALSLPPTPPPAPQAPARRGLGRRLRARHAPNCWLQHLPRRGHKEDGPRARRAGSSAWRLSREGARRGRASTASSGRHSAAHKPSRRCALPVRCSTSNATRSWATPWLSVPAAWPGGASAPSPAEAAPARRPAGPERPIAAAHERRLPVRYRADRRHVVRLDGKKRCGATVAWERDGSVPRV